MDHEVVAFTPNKLRVNHLRLVDVLVVVVVLDHFEYPLDSRIRNERSSDPVVDQTARYLDRASARPELRHNLPSSNFPGTLRLLLRPEEWRGPMKRLLRFPFCFENVSIKCLQRLRVQSHGFYSLRHSPDLRAS